MSNDAGLLSPKVALERLRAGNERFVSGASTAQRGWKPVLTDAQTPMAVVLGCSDSRTPAELIFDQGLGELFVIRVAGNVVAPSGIGSVEFAAAQFGTRLVVVLGHSGCGAVAATVRSIDENQSPASRNLRSITDRIRPHLEELVALGHADRGALMHHAVRANVRASVVQLRHGSVLLENLVATNRLAIVGAELSLETGMVDFFDLPQVMPD
jgi:carbonic anhydrase